MDHLIDRTTQFDVDALETIYHRDFHTTLVMPDSTVATYDKEGFIAHFRKQAEEGKTQLNSWADWHDFHVLGDSAVCVLTRKHSGMSGEEMSSCATSSGVSRTGAGRYFASKFSFARWAREADRSGSKSAALFQRRSSVDCDAGRESTHDPLDRRSTWSRSAQG